MIMQWATFRDLASAKSLVPSFIEDANGDIILWANDGSLTIRCDPLRVGTPDHDEFLASYQSAWNRPDKTYDTEGLPVMRAEPAIIGSGTWIASPNMCDTSGWFDATNKVCMRWEPNPGTVLRVLGSHLIMDASVVETGQADFAGFMGAPATEIFRRSYASKWDYYKACDSIQEFTDGRLIAWDYPSPIVLRSSQNMHINLELPSGAVQGAHCYVKLRCISVKEDS